jgi:PERQ amino acid-rich with GYF domain-containing protein
MDAEPIFLVDEVVGLVLMMQEEDDIADTIYQSSTTLPGKRFAAEFIEKRNADRKSGNSTTFSASRSTAAASASNADTPAAVVPSAASQDAFGYKVVKKKGKGGKA